MVQRRRVLALAVSCALAVVGGPLFAQEQPTPPPVRPRAGRQWQQANPEQMRQRIFQQLQTAMAVSDDEWQVLRPRIEEVLRSSWEQGGASGMRLMAGGRGRGNGASVGAPSGRSPGPAAQKAQELATVLRDESAEPADIKAKLTAYRAAREAAREELAAAREALRELVTQRQEAQLVLMGILD